MSIDEQAARAKAKHIKLLDVDGVLTDGLGIAVSNAYKLVKQKADWCTQSRGGKGAVREACNFIMSDQGTLEDALAVST